MSLRSLIFGTYELPMHASLNLQQNYSPKEDDEYLTMENGDEKLRYSADEMDIVEVSGNGVIPPGFDGLDYRQPMYVSFSKAKSIESSSHIIVLPIKRRSDTGSTPFGKALINNHWVDVSINLVGDTATLGQPAGASKWMVYYFPKIYAFVTRPVQGGGRGNDFNWSLTVREKLDG